MEAEFNRLNHATWECKYHVVFTPKYRKTIWRDGRSAGSRKDI
jgi:REP element-mobilizing transposase RayT